MTEQLRLLSGVRELARLNASDSLPDDIIATRSLPLLVAERDRRLTNREREVLRQVAAGRSDRQIAQDLEISDKTVSNHMTNILSWACINAPRPWPAPLPSSTSPPGIWPDANLSGVISLNDDFASRWLHDEK